MTSAVDSHLRDLESEARDAETEVEAYRDRSQTRIEDMNNQIRELVAKTQMEKAAIKENIERKQQYAKKKQDEVVAFKESLAGIRPSISSNHTSAYQTSARPSVFSEPARNSLASLDESFVSEAVDLPKSAIKTTPQPPAQVQAPASPPDSSTIQLPDQKYLPTLPIIVRSPNGTWLEIRCHLCGGNFIDKKGWIRGARGMLAHTSKSHKLDTLGGKKVDSTSILEFCTHRELSLAEARSLMAGDTKVEMVLCRDIGANGQVSTTPKSTKAPPPPAIVASHTEDDDRPYDWLQKYPTIVLRRDGQWVELRCDLCGGNSLANSDKRFAMGAVGFVRHLSRGHNAKPNFTGSRVEWAVQKCQYREVPRDEIIRLTEGSPGVTGPPKVPFKQSNGRYSTGSNYPSGLGKRRLAKRSSEVFDHSEEDESDIDMDVGDPDFNPDDDGKVAQPESAKPYRRQSVTNSSPKQSYRPPKKLAKLNPESPSPENTTAARPVHPADPLSKYCPCSIAGHACGDTTCRKVAVCTNANHDQACQDNPVAHEVKSTCVMALLGTDCPDGDQCNRGHDNLDQRKRIAAMHDCNIHGDD